MILKLEFCFGDIDFSVLFGPYRLLRLTRQCWQYCLKNIDVQYCLENIDTQDFLDNIDFQNCLNNINFEYSLDNTVFQLYLHKIDFLYFLDNIDLQYCSDNIDFNIQYCIGQIFNIVGAILTSILFNQYWYSLLFRQ